MIIATCGHALTDEDGEDGTGYPITIKSYTYQRACYESGEQIHGKSTDHIVVCKKCLKEYENSGRILYTQEEEDAYFDSKEC